MISKELVNEVLSKTTEQRYFYIGNLLLENNILSFSFVSDEGYNCEMSINIYELAHKCQEWAYSYGYIVQGYFYNKKARADLLKSYYISEQFINNTIPEAIFMACEFVLKNQNSLKSVES